MKVHTEVPKQERNFTTKDMAPNNQEQVHLVGVEVMNLKIVFHLQLVHRI
jgi:hypothetical protein